MENNRINNSVRNAIFGLIKYVVLFIFPFFLRAAIIHRFGVEYVGISSLFSSILQVLNLSELGVSTAIIYAMYEPVATNNIPRVCNLLNLYKKIYRFVGLFILTVGMLLCPFIKHLISGSYPQDINIYIIYIILLINASVSYLLSGYRTTLFTVFQRDDIYSKIQLSANLCVYFIQVISVLVITNFYCYIFALLIGTIINNCIVYYCSKKMYPSIYCYGDIDNSEKKDLFKKVAFLFGHQLDVVIITSADNIIISIFLGLTTLTIYSNYYVIINAMIGITLTIANAFIASIGNSIALETKKKNYKNFIDFTYFITSLTSVLSILMFILFQDFMKIWMGDSMLLDNKIVLLMCLSYYVRFFKRPGNMYKEAMGLWNEDALKPYIAGFTNLCLNIILVQRIGLYGVILSTIFSMAIIEKPWETYVLFKYYFKSGLKKYILVHIKNFLKMIIVGAMAYYVSIRIPVSGFGMFIIKSILCTCGVSIALLLFSFKDNECKYIIDNMRKIARKIINR